MDKFEVRRRQDHIKAREAEARAEKEAARQAGIEQAREEKKARMDRQERDLGDIVSALAALARGERRLLTNYDHTAFWLEYHNTKGGG